MKILRKHSSVDFSKEGYDQLTAKAAFRQLLFAVLANLSVLPPGMALAFPAITTKHLLKEGPIKFTMNEVSWFASLTPLICPIGGPISPYLVNKFGRKGTLIIINVLSIIHWFINATSSQTDNQVLFVELLIARVIGGLTVGLITVPSMIYTTEISHVKIRSRLAVLSTPFFISLGILLIYVLGFAIGVKNFINILLIILHIQTFRKISVLRHFTRLDSL